MFKDVYHGWWMAAVAFLLLMVSMGTVIMSFSVVAVPIAEELQISRTTLMLGMSGMMLTGAVISPLVGRFIDHHSLRLTMAAGAVILAASFLSLSLIRSDWHFIAVYALGMTWVTTVMGPLAVNTLLARWFVQRRALAMGIASIGGSVGGLLFPPLIYHLMELFEWRMGLQVLAGLVLALTLPTVLLLVVDWPEREPRVDREDGEVSEPPPQGSEYNNTLAILRSRNFWLLSWTMGVLFGVYASLMANLVPVALEAGIRADRAAYLISVTAVCGIFGKLFFGLVADALDKRLAIGGAIMLLVAGLGCYYGAIDYMLLLAGAILAGLASGGIMPVWSATMATIFGQINYGRVMGLMGPALLPFNLLLPPVTGFIFDVNESYKPAFLLFITLAVLAMLALPFIRIPAGEHESDERNSKKFGAKANARQTVQ